MFRIDRSVVRSASGEQAYVVLRSPELPPPVEEPVPLPEAPVQQAETEPQQKVREADLEKVRGQAQQILDQAQQNARQQLEQARTQAEALLENARGEAARIVQAGHDEVDQIHQQAFEQGFLAGQHSAQQEYQQRIAAGEAWLLQVVQALSDQREKLITQLEGDALRLSLDMAGKILGMELAISDEAYPAMVRYALTKLKDRGNITLRVSPIDHERFFAPGHLGALGGAALKIAVVPDETLAEGDVLAESQGETLDLGATRQMQMMSDAILPLRGTGLVEDDE